MTPRRKPPSSLTPSGALAARRHVNRSRRVPSASARRKALDLLNLLRYSSLEPVRVVGDPDGGVALYVSARNSGYARLLVTNEGDMIASFVDPATTDVFAFEEAGKRTMIDRVRAFVSA